MKLRAARGRRSYRSRLDFSFLEGGDAGLACWACDTPHDRVGLIGIRRFEVLAQAFGHQPFDGSDRRMVAPSQSVQESLDRFVELSGRIRRVRQAKLDGSVTGELVA